MSSSSDSRMSFPVTGSGAVLRVHGDGREIGRQFLSLNAGVGEGAPSKLEQTAIHEAAHTVVATMIHPGIVREVFIRDNAADPSDGALYDELKVSGHGQNGGVRFNKIQTTVFENGLIAYSGFFAECENFFRSGVDLGPLLPQLRAQAAHDMDTFHELLVAGGLSEEEIHSVVSDIGGALKHYFDNGVWEAARTIADALLVRGRLTGEEVLELLPGFP
jgi:hypothetical protein